MHTLISDDPRFTIWMHEITPPPQAKTATLWIEHNMDPDQAPNMTWTVEVKIYFEDRIAERLRGWGKTRHDAFARLRQRLNDLRGIKIRA